MNVLDPFEVAEIRVWPLDVAVIREEQRRDYLDRAEFTVFQKVIAESKLGAILNEKPPRPTQVIELPKSYARRIIPTDIFPHRKHPDIRIARRAATIASLARRYQRAQREARVAHHPAHASQTPRAARRS
jgi:hypothetical protein